MEKLSIILPAYNEATTFPTLMHDLLSLKLQGLEREIIIVESNSTDGTRELVQRYADEPEIKILLEDSPGGKGRAVRKGLALATGEYVLIQDADLEYDINDYEKLLAPLRAGRADFVLGSRHSTERRSWKIRTFDSGKMHQHYLNMGHILFTQLFNLVYGQRLKDPFTMFKVFRRSCIHGLHFTANRFDFDWELVGKLCRKGYTPLEIPVHYEARSFAEGKKVSLIRDPVLWIVACFKYRFCKLLHQA